MTKMKEDKIFHILDQLTREEYESMFLSNPNIFHSEFVKSQYRIKRTVNILAPLIAFKLVYNIINDITTHKNHKMPFLVRK